MRTNLRTSLVALIATATIGCVYPYNLVGVLDRVAAAERAARPTPLPTIDYERRRLEEEAARAAEARAEEVRVQAEKARRRRNEQERHAAVVPQLPAILARLEERYGWVRGKPRVDLLNAFRALPTVAGTPLLSDVEIDGDKLFLWAENPNVLYQNTRAWAEYAETFIVWCQCDGRTSVGLDYSHVGGPRGLMMLFKINPETGRVELTG